MRKPRRPRLLLGGHVIRPPKHHGPKAKARHHARGRRAGAKGKRRQPPQPPKHHPRKHRPPARPPRHHGPKAKAHGRKARRPVRPKAHHRPPKTRTRKKLHHRKLRGLAGPVTGGAWVTGGNDQAATCVATAVANSLLIAAGIRVADADVADLHERAGGGMTAITGVLRALLRGGLGGHRALRVRAARSLVPGVVAGAGPHAVTVTRPGWCVSWGAETRLPAVSEAWAITWEAGVSG